MSEGEKLNRILILVDSKKGISISTNEIAKALDLPHEEVYDLTSRLAANGDLYDCSSKDNKDNIDVFSTKATKAAIASGKYEKQILITKIPAGYKMPILFISYSWANKREAEIIHSDLKQIGIDVKMDDHEMVYKDNINDFMRSIRDADYAIVLISDNYLKSKNCMYEVSHLLKEKEVKKKILPVILDDTHIFKTEDRLRYIKFWQDERKKLESSLDGIDVVNAIEAYNDLKTVSEIASLTDSFIKEISNMITIKFTDLKNVNYLPILKEIGFEDVTWATDLLYIVHMKSITQKEAALNEYITKHKPNSFFYAVKAQTYFKEKNYTQAEFNYLQAIKLDPNNTEALNNLGRLYEHIHKQYKKAKDLYEKAISVNPKMTIARLNLGVLLSQHFSDDKGARIQYESILSYDPNDPSAHNNLGNLYIKKLPNVKAKRKAISHFKKAIESDPSFLNSYLNYGGLLRLLNQIEDSHKIYEQGRKYDIDGGYSKLVDTLIKLNTKK